MNLASSTMLGYTFLLIAIGISAVECSGGFWGGPIIRNHPVTATGQVRCLLNGTYQPLPHIKIELVDEDGLIDAVMASTTTNSTGFFHVSGEGRDGLNQKPDPKIRIEYAYSGTFGRLHIEKDTIFGENRKEETEVKSNRFSSYIQFGQLDYDNEHCRAYYRFYTALKYYYALSGEKTPYRTLHVRTDASQGDISANTDVIRIPHSRDPISQEVADKYFAHTIRHSYDGSIFQYWHVSRKYQYSQYHSCDKRTNGGLAFNEGWALYYADLCTSECKAIQCSICYICIILYICWLYCIHTIYTLVQWVPV